MSFESDESVVAELKSFTENDGDIYRRTTTPILKNLTTKKAQGKYSSEKAVQAFMYLAEAGAREYIKQHGSPGDVWYEMFPINIRREAAREWRDEFEAEHALGNYDRLLPKKYQTKKKPEHDYRITIREGSNRNKKFTVKANSYEEAARKIMPKISKGATAIRVTGEIGKSGIFQGSKSILSGGQTSVGPIFHVGG